MVFELALEGHGECIGQVSVEHGRVGDGALHLDVDAGLGEHVLVVLTESEISLADGKTFTISTVVREVCSRLWVASLANIEEQGGAWVESLERAVQGQR